MNATASKCVQPNNITDRDSEVTIYQKAVRHVAPTLDACIEQYINSIRKSANKN